MNTQHLQYVVEIERMRSISQAAENLFIGQPNLSRILHDMEDTLGFKIFERTSRGVRPTERGTIFLQHAKSILREMDSIEALGPRRPVANRLRICIPRSAAMLDLTSAKKRRSVLLSQFDPEFPPPQRQMRRFPSRSESCRRVPEGRFCSAVSGSTVSV